jgi:hypothetical protein
MSFIGNLWGMGVHVFPSTTGFPKEPTLEFVQKRAKLVGAYPGPKPIYPFLFHNARRRKHAKILA